LKASGQFALAPSLYREDIFRAEGIYVNADTLPQE
jgi:hypothetical protein